MENIYYWLRRPMQRTGTTWANICVPLLIVFVILYGFQPFGISMIQNETSKLLCVGCSVLLSLLCTVVFFIILPAVFKDFYAPEHWTVGRYLLMTTCFIMSIAVSIWVFICSFADIWGLDSFIQVSVWVLLVSIFPVGIMLLWDRNRILTQNLRDAADMNKQLDRKQEKPQTHTTVSIMDGTKDTYTLVIDELLYAEADGNYVKLHTLHEGKAGQTIIRSTLKQIEDATQAHGIVRCHRAYIVNTKAVVNVEGNSQGYRLTLRGCTAEVPVSRTYTRVLKDSISSQN